MHEWALLIFTICLQAAIGGVVMLALFYKKISALGEEKTYQIFKLPLIVFASLSVIGLAASFAHLGTPLNALNTIRNFGSSWMSREIVFTGLFIAAVFVTLALALARKKSAWALWRQRCSSVLQIFFAWPRFIPIPSSAVGVLSTHILPFTGRHWCLALFWRRA